MIVPNDEDLAVAAIHREGVVGRLRNLAILELEIVTANKSHTRMASSES